MALIDKTEYADCNIPGIKMPMKLRGQNLAYLKEVTMQNQYRYGVDAAYSI